MIASTLDDRAAFDARLAAGTVTPQLRADDAAGQAAMRACLAGGASSAECAAQIGSGIDSKGFFCPTTLRIDANGKTCVANSAPSAAKAAALLKEAQATAGPAPSSVLPFVIGGIVAAGVLVLMAWGGSRQAAKTWPR